MPLKKLNFMGFHIAQIYNFSYSSWGPTQHDVCYDRKLYFKTLRNEAKLVAIFIRFRY